MIGEIYTKKINRINKSLVGQTSEKKEFCTPYKMYIHNGRSEEISQLLHSANHNLNCTLTNSTPVLLVKLYLIA